MSEFGNETATATMKAGEKSIEALMKLLKFIMERNDRKLNKELKKEQVRQIKSSKDKELATEYLNMKRGYARATKLFNSGERLIPLTATMSPSELSRFNRLAKIEGIAFTAISNQRAIEELRTVKKELKDLDRIAKTDCLTEKQTARQEELSSRKEKLENNRQDRIVIIRAKDLELVKDITDRMNMEIQFGDINEELGDLLNKGEKNLTKDEKLRVDELLKEKDSLLKNEFSVFNDKNNDVIYASTVDNPKWEKMSFERAINRATDREYSQEPCYACERTNPECFMEITSKPQEHNGRFFTNTEYKVYNNGVEQKCDEFSHGMFSHYSRKNGENSSIYGDEHWQNMKNEMKEKGGFSEDILIFSSKDDFTKYKDEFKKTQEKITLREDSITYEADKNSYKDYMGMVNTLNGQLADHNLSINEQRQVCKADSGETIHLDKNMTDDEKMAYAEAINIGKQIDTYQKLNQNQTQLAFIRQQQEVNEESFGKQGKPESLKDMYEQMRENLYKQAYDKVIAMSSLNGELHKLQLEREQLSSIKIVDMLQEQHNEDEMLSVQNRQHDSSEKEFQNEMEKETSTHREEHTQSKQQWSKEVYNHNATTTTKTEKVSVKTTDREM